MSYVLTVLAFFIATPMLPKDLGLAYMAVVIAIVYGVYKYKHKNEGK